MLNANIPVLELDSIKKLPVALEDMGVEIVHSHHAWVDSVFCTLLEGCEEPKIVVTTHGMYELIDPKDFSELLPLLKKRVSKFVYTADKNLAVFATSGIEQGRFVKIGNALEESAVHPIDRATLGIAATAFVICLVSRAVPEKGWHEAIESVRLARQLSRRDIQLVLIGEGPEYARIKASSPEDFVHLLGFKSNIRDYFAMADLGLLPSRFTGESFPLVLIDCLHANRPVLASNVGEISSMLEADQGHAGTVFDLVSGAIPIEPLAEQIAEYATNPALYQKHLERVSAAVKKFDPEIMVEKYGNVYAEVT
jgi:glycosyltransferase involved in cell wall biosynthesis